MVIQTEGIALLLYAPFWDVRSNLDGYCAPLSRVPFGHSRHGVLRRDRCGTGAALRGAGFQSVLKNPWH